ncbi:MAG: outer membrane protein assembly factor, partial [Fidelibacterota bacterium]
MTFRNLHFLLIPYLLLVSPAQGQIGTARYTVEDINLEGNETFSSRRLQALIKLKKPFLFRSSEFNGRALKLDAITLRNFYVSQGFRSATVSESYEVLEKNKVDILFQIHEGNRSYLQSVTVEGNESIPEKEILRILGLKVGEPFNPVGVKRGFSELEYEYARIGKLFVSGKRDYEPGEQIHFHLTIDEGPTAKIDRIMVEGLGDLDSTFVFRELRFKHGTVYSEDLVRLSQRQIFETGLFSLVDISPAKSTIGADWVNVRVNVRRFDVREVLIEPGISRIRPISGGGEPISGAEGTIQFLDRSMFRSGTRFRMRGSIQFPIEAIERAFGKVIFRSEASLSSQWVSGWRAPNSLKLFAERVPEEDRFLTRYGSEWNGLHKFSERSTVQGGLRWTRIITPDEAKREKEQERSIRLVYRYRNLDNPIMPTRGANLAVESSVVGSILGGTRDYYRVELDYRHFTPVGSSKVLALRTKLGRMEPLGRGGIPSYDLFY